MEGKNKSLLLDEFTNNVAGIKAFNQNISLGNVLNDKKNRLICIDVNNHLKVFNGEIIEDENPLKEMLPVSGIVTYFSFDKETNLKNPYLAVASGFHLYIYKFLKGIKKIPIPEQIQNSVEQYIYDLLSIGEIKPKECLEKLEKLAEKFMRRKNLENDNLEDIIGIVEDDKILQNKEEGLSNMTQELLSLEDDNSKISFLNNNCNKQIKINNYITILSSISQNDFDLTEPDSYLIVGTENCSIFIINPAENKIIDKGKLPTVPFLINSSGGYISNHKLLIADRGCNIYIMKKTKIQKTIIVNQPMVNILSEDKSIYLGTTGKNYISLKYNNGEQEFSITQPNTITSMELAKREMDDILILIATKDSELRIYRKKELCYILKIGDCIFGMKFGTLGTRKECIIMCTYGGALLVKYFNPDIKASELKKKDEKCNLNNNKIDVPKKPSIYRDFVQREKESKSEIQKKFITDLIRIKYKAMDTYVKILKKGNTPQNFSNSSNLKISASLEGLGPNFKLNILFNNMGTKPIYGVILILDFNRRIYSFKKENIQLSIIMPNVPVNYSLPFRNISENGSSGSIKLLIIGKNEIIPLIQTNIKVPASELDIL